MNDKLKKQTKIPEIYIDGKKIDQSTDPITKIIISQATFHPNSESTHTQLINNISDSIIALKDKNYQLFSKEKCEEFNKNLEIANNFCNNLLETSTAP